MTSVLLIIFILQLVLHIIKTVGATAINDLLWELCNKFPTPTSKSASQQIKLRREIVRFKRELNSVSAQDEFSKWAKLRRQHDKAVADYDKLTSSLQSSQSSFNTQLNVFRLISINGLRLFLQWSYNRKPLFWIPKGWLPFFVEWLLSFPMAPRGSISIYIWGVACASVIQMVSDALVAGFVLAVGGSRQAGNSKAGAEAEKKAK